MPAQVTEQGSVSLETVGRTWDLQEEWPLGKLAKPSFNFEASGCRQAVEETNRFHSGSWLPSPPRAYCCTAAGSRLHLDRKSGLGLPITSLSPSVKKNVVARASASPIQAVCHSHNFILHTSDFGVPRDTPGPGVKTSATKAVSRAGMINAMVTRRPVEIFSCSTYGKDMSGSTGENGLWFPLFFQKPAPTARIPLYFRISTYLFRALVGESLHDDDPINHV